MLRQILLAGTVSACNIMIHALTMAAVVSATRAVTRRFDSRRSELLIAAMIATSLVLMTAHVLEVIVWAAAYAIFEVAPAGTDMYYFAFVNYTTLGYGDVIPVQRWRLVGPMTAMNGVLLFGWSTAVLFHVLLRVLEKAKV